MSVAATPIPRVSVICAAYNGEAFLPRTIAGLRSQELGDFEAIFVDDGSTDATPGILAGIEDPRFVVATNDRNRHINYTRNRAASLARASYVAVTDQDDVSHPSRLRRQVAFLDAHPKVSAVYSQIRYINGLDQPVGASDPWAYSGQQARVAFMFHNFVTHSTLMFRRDHAPDPVYVSDYPLCEDYSLLVKLADSGSGICVLRQQLVDYRCHDSNHTHIALDRMAQYSRQLRGTLLERLGITPSQSEMDLHDVFEAGPSNATPALFRQCGEWLMHLADANVRMRYVPRSAFDAVVADKWLELSHKFIVLGRGAWQIYRHGPSDGLERRHTLSVASLWTKCTVSGARRQVGASSK
jgi:glycosyltransferase involved in cell wall biosynthesis